MASEEVTKDTSPSLLWRLVAFLYFDICHLRQNNSHYENPEFFSPFKDLGFFTEIVNEKYF